MELDISLDYTRYSNICSKPYNTIKIALHMFCVFEFRFWLKAVRFV